MILIKNGLIHVGNGQVLRNKDVLIENNIIKKIDENIELNEEATIIDARGMEVFPGFIDPVSSIGTLDMHFSYTDNEERSNPITPEMNIRYGFNFDQMEIQELYKVGITSIGASPSNSNVMGGQMAVFKTHAKNSNKALVRERVALKCSVTNLVKSTFGEKGMMPKTKMGIFYLLDSTLKKAQDYDGSQYDKQMEVLKKVLNKEMKLFITANTKSEIDALINVLEKYDVDFVICNAYEAHRSIEKIKQNKAGIVIGDLVYLSKLINMGTDLKALGNLIKDGHSVSLTMIPETYGSGREEYLWNAIELYKAGVCSEDVISMMTLQAAEMLNVSEVIGSIEEGKEADISIFTKNPIELYDAQVAYSIIGGEIVFQGIGGVSNVTN